MKQFVKKSIVLTSIASLVTASLLYADTNGLETPPTVSDLNNDTTIEQPPGATGTNGGDSGPVNCEYGEYYSPFQNSCVDINPITKTELTTGIWLDVVVDHSSYPPAATSDRSGCVAFTPGQYDYDVNATIYEKEMDGSLEIESPSYASYDETTGMLSMNFYDMDSTGTAATHSNDDYEEFYITREGNNTFLLKYDYYGNGFFIDGLVENITTGETCSDYSDSLVFENDYFNPNVDKEIQVTGNVYLPDDVDPYSVSVQAVTQDWHWISHSNLDVVNGNAYTLGFDNSEQVAIQVNFGTPNEWYDYFYTSNGWERADWSKPMSDYVMTIDANQTLPDLNVSAIFASQIKLEGNVTVESGTKVFLEFINVQNGNYFGWQELTDSNSDFKAVLPTTDIGDKFIVRVNLEKNYQWESYFVDFRNGEQKLVADQNIEWTSRPSDNGEYDIWLPNPEQTGYYELTDTNGDSTITQDDIQAISLSFSSDALDSQFYIVEGNITVPAEFSPASDQNNYMGDRVSFEVMDKDSGEWLGWSELDAYSTPTTDTNGDKVYQYKIKLDSDRNITLRVNYEENSNGAHSFEGYYVAQDGTLISDRKIEHKPVLEDWDGNPLVENGKTSDQCWQEGNFWWSEPGMDHESGKCYDEHPHKWIPNVGDTYLTFTNQKSLVNIDFVSLEDSVFKLEGHIVLPSDFVPSHDWQNRRMIMIEAIDADTGMWLGNTNISENEVNGQPNTYAYSMKLQDVDANTNILVKLIKEESNFNTGFNEWEAYYLEFTSETNTTVIGLKKEESVQWIESNTTNEWGYKDWIPDLEDSFKIDLDENNKLIEVNVVYETLLGTYESNRMVVKGIITLTEPVTLGQTFDYWWNNVRVELINTNTGDWIGSDEASCPTNSCTELTYDIEVPKEGNYTVKLIKEIDGTWEELYYNFGSDHDVNGTDANADSLVNGQKVQWVEAQEVSSYGGDYKHWMPNPEQTGWVTVSSGEKKDVNFDFASLADSQLTFEGTITVAHDFKVGSVCTDGTADSDVKRCEWENSDNMGYNVWYGSRSLRVEVIDANNGDYVASTDLRKKEENTNDYKFKLVLADDKDSTRDYIVKINKEVSKDGQWKFDEIYYNFGDNNSFDGLGSTDTTEKLVNGKKVMWTEASVVNQWGYRNWMPDSSQTGFVRLSDTSLTDFVVDISQLGANDNKIKGVVTFKSDFDLSNDNSWANISAIDASTGMWIADTPIEEDGSYELNLGEETGEYILQINYSYYDYENWQNSWWKNKYYDFGSNKTYDGVDVDDEVLNEQDVRWVPKLGTANSISEDYLCWQAGNFWDYEALNGNQACYPQPEYWVPNVNGVTVDATINDVNIDLSVAVGNTLGVEITNFPQGAMNKYVFIVNPTTYSNVWQYVEGNSTQITELKDGNYTVEFGYELNGQWKNFFMSGANNSAVPGEEVRWTDLGNGVWGPNPSDTTYLDLQTDTNLSITIPAVASNNVAVTISGLENGLDVSADFTSVSKPFGRWEQNTSTGGQVGFNFNDVKNGEFILSFWYDGNQYVYDATTPDTLVKDPEWVAKNDSGTVVCGGTVGWNNCDWDNSYNWIWTPDVTPLTINDADVNINASLPVAIKVSGALDLDAELAGNYVWVSVFKYNGYDWNSKDFTLDSNGDVNGSIKIDGGEDYRIEIWVDGLGGYVYTEDVNNDGTRDDSGWITQMKSWDETTWSPKAGTLIDINSDLDLGTISLGAGFNTVTVTFQNIDRDGSNNVSEGVWVSLESDTEGYFGDGNENWENYPVTYDENITIKVPSANDYKLLVFPMNHKGGFTADSNADNTLDSIGWNVAADILNISTDTVLTVEFPGAETLGDINGTVVCGAEDCSGWVEAWNMNDGKGTPVSSDGTFEIKGLSAGTYELVYWSYFENTVLSETGVSVTADAVTTVDTLVKSADTTYSDINGTVSTSVDGVYVSLLETDGTDWELVSTTDIKADGTFSFGSMPKVTGKEYYVVGTTLTRGASAYEIEYADPTSIINSSTISLPSLGSFAYSGSDIDVTVNKQ